MSDKDVIERTAAKKAKLIRESQPPLEINNQSQPPDNNVSNSPSISDMVFNQLMANASLMRSDALARLLNPGKDINYECGYPPDIAKNDYTAMFDREGLATRVVTLMPEESWAMFPEIQETEKAEESEFEKEWKALEKERKIFHYLQRVDILSGIGRYGVLLLGLDDGKVLSEPVEGIDLKTGEKVGESQRKLLYLKPFNETAAEISTKELDSTSPRFGQPILYDLKFEQTDGVSYQNQKVHWTRVIHLADLRATSDIFGTPRMQSNYNRLLDCRKILGSSAEMFWKGGFQGIGFETHPENSDVEIDNDSLKEQMREYMAGIQRYLAVQGMSIKTLQSSIEDPTGHIKIQLQIIALTLGVPFRIFMGTEEAKLAGTQDAKNWNKRVNKRREEYLTPLVIRPLIDRLMVYGILPEVEDYQVVWPDLDAPSDKEKMEVAKLATEAMSKYVAAGVEALMTPQDYFVNVLGYSEELAEELVKNADAMVDSTLGSEEEEEE
jgi:hypothetical protein